jgi:ketosteroid isomerase-like protein
LPSRTDACILTEAREQEVSDMSKAAEVVEQYHAAFGNGDAQAARSLLADDLHFKGPIEEFDSADQYMESVGKLAQIVTGVDVQKVVAEGDDVVTIYDLHTNTPAGTSNVAEWATVRKGKIAEMRVFFDARPFAAMFEQG